MPKARTAAELEASKLRARRRRRRLLGWPEELLDAPARAYGTRERARIPDGPPPPAYDRHPIVDEAVRALKPYERAELGGSMDSIALDLVSAYCLAVLEGDDPTVALQLERARYAKDRRWLIYGLSTVTGLTR